MDNKLTIIYEPAEEGGFTAYIAEVPGAISEGETIEEAREMVMDALHELTMHRREEALRGKHVGAVVESFAAAF
ncbi:MAG: type II toxin-antitoxin system HicB family antitoxin [Fimbriimonas sp.]